MKRKAIVHIGLPKTGTTAIQGYLAKHRAQLRDHGVALSAAPGRRNHIALAAYAQGKTNNAALRSGGDAHLNERLEHALGREAAELPASVHTVLFSSEQLARVSNAGGTGRLHALLAPHFERIEIVAYLRRQDEMAVSRYTTSLQAGGETRYAILPGEADAPSFFDFARIIEAYAASFGSTAIRPRIYDRATFPEKNVILDFLAMLGLPGLVNEAALPVSGGSLGASAQEIVRRFNLLAETQAAGARPQLSHLLRDPIFRGEPRLPSRDEAIAFMARYRDGNEAIRRQYFQDRASLFSEDFSRYPTATEQALPDDAALLDTAMQALIRVAMAWQDSKAETELRLGRQAEASGDLAAARARFGKAVRAKRNLAEANEALRRIAGRADDGQELAARAEDGETTVGQAADARERRRRRKGGQGTAPTTDRQARRDARRRRLNAVQAAPPSPDRSA